MIWTLVEPGVAIIASSLVTIRPLLRAWKIRGFQSTENSKHTGPFSHGNPGSRTGRSQGKSGYGSRDTSRHDSDLERGHSQRRTKGSDFSSIAIKSHRSKISNMSRISEGELGLHEDGSKISDVNGIQVTRRIEIHSEMYIIDGRPSPEPHGEEWLSAAPSSSNSSIELTGMGPVQSQTDGRVGLGSPRGQ